MRPDMLFRFSLKPLDRVLPWGEPDDLSLHWFGLTDGWSWMDVGSTELFRYSSTLLARWSAPAGGPMAAHPEYQVIRL